MSGGTRAGRGLLRGRCGCGQRCRDAAPAAGHPTATRALRQPSVGGLALIPEVVDAAANGDEAQAEEETTDKEAGSVGQLQRTTASCACAAAILTVSTHHRRATVLATQKSAVPWPRT